MIAHCLLSLSMGVILVNVIACFAAAQSPRCAVSFMVFARHDVAPRPIPVRVAEFVDVSGHDHSALFSDGESTMIIPGRYRYRLHGTGIAAKGYVSVHETFQIVKIVVDKASTVVGTGQPVAMDGLHAASKISGRVVNRGRSAPLTGRAIVVARLLIDGSREYVGRIDQDGTFELAGVDPGLVHLLILDESGLRYSELVSVPPGAPRVLHIDLSLESLRLPRPLDRNAPDRSK